MLGLVYGQTMERINGQLDDHRHLARLVLSWITHAVRPLTNLELQHALAIEPGDEEFDQDNLPEVEDMVSVCAGLITVEDQSGIIRLVHYTTQEYFERTQQRWFPDAEFDISETCATYLSLEDLVPVKEWCDREVLKRRLRCYPLYKYAADNWGLHTRNASCVSDATVRFLLSDRHAKAAGRVMQLYSSTSHAVDCEDEPGKLLGLHLAAHFGLDTVIQLLVDTHGVDVNRRSGHGQTPLIVAAMEGQLAAVQVLLAADGIDVDATGYPFEYTALYHAAKKGHDVVVQTLLDTGKVDVNKLTFFGTTPLHEAAMEGRESVVRILLATGQAHVNAQDKYGRTPLTEAILAGCTGVVQVLLAAGGIEGDQTAEDERRRMEEFFGT